jgi:hypothetical protein
VKASLRRDGAMFTPASFVNMTRPNHLKLDQTKIDRAKKLLGAKTEQETIDRALDRVLGEERNLKAHRRVRAVGGFDHELRAVDTWRPSRRSSMPRGAPCAG